MQGEVCCCEEVRRKMHRKGICRQVHEKEEEGPGLQARDHPRDRRPGAGHFLPVGCGPARGLRDGQRDDPGAGVVSTRKVMRNGRNPPEAYTPTWVGILLLSVFVCWHTCFPVGIPSIASHPMRVIAIPGMAWYTSSDAP